MSLRPVDEDEKAGMDEYALQSLTPGEKSEDIGGLGGLGGAHVGLGDGKGEAGGGGNDILDDMEKFQREIEELRLRFTKAK